MAKKSTATRQQSTTPRRPQTAKPSSARPANVTLVRAPKPADAVQPTGTPSPASGVTAETKLKTATPPATMAKKPAAEKPVSEKRAPTTPVATRPRAPEITTRPKPAATRPQTSQQQTQPAPGSAAAKAQAVRIARARAVQRARTANLVTPEHYSYVARDLKLIAVLACAMVVVLIVLHFTLPA